MTAALTNHLWQSTVFAIAAGLGTLALRRNRANVRYWLWFSASLKFVVPFALFVGLGGHVKAPRVASAAVSTAIEQVTEPFPVNSGVVVEARRDWVPAMFFWIWACGFFMIAAIRFRGWRRVRAAVRSSVASEIVAPVEVRCSPGLLEPGVVGLFKQILLMPEGIADRLTARQLEAVLAHELCHVRRRDNLTSAMHMIVEAVFWFHPLVWWIGARLVEERERACDEEVLRLGGEPQDYAEAILSVCKLYVESPLVCVSGVTGANLKKRIEAIMRNRVALRLNVWKKTALAAVGIVAIAVPFLVGIVHAAQTAPKFEVASIRLCDGSGGAMKGGGEGRGGAGGGGMQGPSPDRLSMNCQPLRGLIRTAYFVYRDGHRAPPEIGPPMEGGPSWVDSERYQVTAKAEGTPGQDMMRGPMLQALLEDRFKLKIRRESREVPAYLLTVAKSGPKLQAAKEGGCNVLDFSKPPALPEPGKEYVPICALRMVRGGNPNSPIPWFVYGGTLDELARALSNDLDRIVVNKTGIAGKYDYHLEFGADETTAGLNRLRGPDGPVVTPSTASDPSGGLSIFSAIQQQLGLKLEPGKGAKEFLVIERVERPTEN